MKLKKLIPGLIGAALGAISGAIYYFTIGCNSGSCDVAGSPYKTIIIAALVGYLLFDTGNDIYNRIQKRKNKEIEK